MLDQPPKAAREIAEAIRDDLNGRRGFDFGELDEDIQEEILQAHSAEAWSRVKPLVERLAELHAETAIANCACGNPKHRGHALDCPLHLLVMEWTR